MVDIDVTITVFGCCNIPPIDIDECCKKHGANVAAEFFFPEFGCKDVFDFLNIARGYFHCCRYVFHMLQMLCLYVTVKRRDVRALALPY